MITYQDLIADKVVYAHIQINSLYISHLCLFSTLVITRSTHDVVIRYVCDQVRDLITTRPKVADNSVRVVDTCRTCPRLLSVPWLTQGQTFWRDTSLRVLHTMANCFNILLRFSDIIK